MTRKQLAQEIYRELIKSGQVTILSEAEYVRRALNGVGALKPQSKRDLEYWLKGLRERAEAREA